MNEKEEQILRNAIYLIMVACRDGVGSDVWADMARAYGEKMDEARRAQPQPEATK